MAQEGSDGQSADGAVSIGAEDQLREAEMERRQRREDDGIGVPEQSNPHILSPGAGRRGATTPAAKRDDKAPTSAESDEIWEGRADDPDHPGQTAQGGLGGSGPVQP